MSFRVQLCQIIKITLLHWEIGWPECSISWKNRGVSALKPSELVKLVVVIPNRIKNKKWPKQNKANTPPKKTIWAVVLSKAKTSEPRTTKLFGPLAHWRWSWGSHRVHRVPPRIWAWWKSAAWTLNTDEIWWSDMKWNDYKPTYNNYYSLKFSDMIHHWNEMKWGISHIITDAMMWNEIIKQHITTRGDEEANINHRGHKRVSSSYNHLYKS